MDSWAAGNILDGVESSMLKRIITATMMACTIPAMANAWTLNTQAMSAGGTITSINKATAQTVLDGSLSTAELPLLPSISVDFAPLAGYVVSKVVKIVTDVENPGTPSKTTINSPIIGSIVATPVRATDDVTVQVTYRLDATSSANTATALVAAAGGGTVSPSTTTYIRDNFNALAQPLVFKFTPDLGHKVMGISANGLSNEQLFAFTRPQNAASAGAKANRVVTVTIPTGTVVTANIVLTGTFDGSAVPIVASAGESQTVLAGTQVTLNGNGSTGGSYSAWRLIASPTWNLEMHRANPTLYPVPAGFSSSTVSFTTPALTLPVTTPATTQGTYTFEYRIADAVPANGQRTASIVQVTVLASGSTLDASVKNCITCHNAIGIGQSPNVANIWAASKHKTAGVACYTCHKGTNTGGHPGQLTSGSVSETTFNYNASFGSGNFCSTCHNPSITSDFTASKHFGPAGTASCSFCHVQGVHNPAAACINCHNPGNPLGLPWPPTGMNFHDEYTGTNLCTTCHNKHSTSVSGCGSCHDNPPATASHLKHFGSTTVVSGYGDLRITGAFTNYSSGYVFGCGNCHPMDISKHKNGVVDVELYNFLATAGSIKARNPSSAGYVVGSETFTDSKGLTYTTGKCSNVYCHSYNESATTATIGDGESNWEAKVVTTRMYKTVTWGSSALGCAGCHGNPTQTTSLTNDGGAGDSHSWIDSQGYQNLHTYNMGGDPVSCKFCHNDTVKQLNTYTSDSMSVRTLSAVPISNFSKHVNGNNDVAFDAQNPFVYKTYYSGDVSRSLAGAAYAPETKTCSNVSCHREQTVVKWGTPYRWYYKECNVCHSY